MYFHNTAAACNLNEICTLLHLGIERRRIGNREDIHVDWRAVPVSFLVLQCCPSCWLHSLCFPRCHTVASGLQSLLPPLGPHWCLVLTWTKHIMSGSHMHITYVCYLFSNVVFICFHIIITNMSSFYWNYKFKQCSTKKWELQSNCWVLVSDRIHFSFH